MSYRSLFFVTASVIIISAFIWHLTPSTKVVKSSTINVVCTTSIIADTVRAIGGDHITVTCLMGPGIDPHVYRAREHDVHKLANADIIFYHGLHLEGKMVHMLAQMQSYTTSVAVTDAIPKKHLITLPESGNQYDPHVWFDASLWIYVAEYIGKTLAQHDPAHAHVYAHNTQVYVDKLRETDATLITAMHAIPEHRRIIVTAHDAFSYFGKAYGCTVVGLQGISTESEAGVADITNLADYLIKHRISVVFAESCVSPKALEALCNACKARGWQVDVGPTLYTDALGDVSSKAETYLEMMRYTGDTFTQALTS